MSRERYLRLLFNLRTNQVTKTRIMPTWRLRDWFYEQVIENELYKEAVAKKIDIEIATGNTDKLSESYQAFLKNLIPWFEDTQAKENKNKEDDLVAEYKKMMAEKKG